MGTHISVYVTTHCPKGRGKYGKLVQWTEELPCFAHECKEQGSVIFFIALRITSLQLQTDCCSMRQCNTMLKDTLNSYVPTKRERS